MAAELVVDPGVPHSFLHDLKSTYFILLFHCITNMKHSLSKGATTNLFHNVLDLRHYTQDGGWQKFGFMLQKKWILKYNIPSVIASYWRFDVRAVEGRKCKNPED